MRRLENKKIALSFLNYLKIERGRTEGSAI
jgi:hypothetical protein